MQTVTHHARFLSGCSCTLRPDRLDQFFSSGLENVLDGDRVSAAPLNGPDAAMLGCDRELCLVAGQLLAIGALVDTDALRNEFVCWFDERVTGALPAAPDGHAT